MPTAVAWSTNLVIFAGAAQLATVSLAATATWLTLVATAAVINLRHVMYSAALSPRFNDQPRWFRWIGPFFLIDQLFALTSVRTELSGPTWRRFYLSAGIFYFLSWTTVVTLGLLVGSSIPVEWRLDVAPAIMFAGLVVLGLTNRPGNRCGSRRCRRVSARARCPEQRRHPRRCGQRCDRRLPRGRAETRRAEPRLERGRAMNTFQRSLPSSRSA